MLTGYATDEKVTTNGTAVSSVIGGLINYMPYSTVTVCVVGTPTDRDDPDEPLVAALPSVKTHLNGKVDANYP